MERICLILFRRSLTIGKNNYVYPPSRPVNAGGTLISRSPGAAKQPPRWGIYPTKPLPEGPRSGTGSVRKWGMSPISKRFWKSASYYGLQALSATITGPACGVGPVFRMSRDWLSLQGLVRRAPTACRSRRLRRWCSGRFLAGWLVPIRPRGPRAPTDTHTPATRWPDRTGCTARGNSARCCTPCNAFDCFLAGDRGADTPICACSFSADGCCTAR